MTKKNWKKTKKIMKKSTKNTTKTILNEFSQKNSMKIDEIIKFNKKKRFVSQCKYRNIYFSFLIRLMWFKHDEIEIKNDLKCMKVLKKIIQFQFEKKRLKHVCHWHFYTLTRRFKFCTKQLNIENFRFRFRECWNHRNNFNVLKTNKIKSI